MLRSVLGTALFFATIVRAAPPQAAAPTGTSTVILQYLQHSGFSWECERSPHFEYCFEPTLKDDRNRALAQQNAEFARTQVLKLAGVMVYEPLIHVFFVETRGRMNDLIGFDGEGRSRPNQHAIFFVPTPVRPDLTHELCHEILSNLWGNAEAWIEEGVATYAVEGRFAEIECQEMLAKGELLPLGKLVNAEWDPSMYKSQNTYGQLAGFVKYLKDVYGIDRVRDVWKGGSVSIPTVFDKSLPQLEKAWHNSLRGRSTAAAQ